MAKWEYSLWFSMPGRDELIQSGWKPAPTTLEAQEAARAVADEVFAVPGALISCETEEGHRYILPIGQIQWVRVMIREKEQSNGP